MHVYIIVIKFIEYINFVKQKLNNNLIKNYLLNTSLFIQLNISNSKLGI